MKKSFYGSAILLLGILSTNSNILLAQSSVFWGTLKQGPYTVGYKTIWTYDYARTWGNSPRPIRMNVWYPAQKTHSKNMLFERYVLSEYPEMRFSLYADELMARDIGDASKSLKGLFK